jgi:hypothetical protein
MPNAKLISVLIVLIVAVAGAGLYLLSGDDGAGRYRSSDDTGRLMIYGNANNDDYLDQEDVAALEKILAGEAGEIPYADANLDGRVDQADLDMVKRMVKREEMTINYDYYFGGRLMQGKVGYPISAACVVGPEVIAIVKSIGAAGKIKSVSGGDLDSTLFSDLASLPRISDVRFSANAEEVSKYPVSAVITQDSAMYVPNHASFAAAGIDVVRIAAAEGTKSLAGAITLGYLLQCEDSANEYAEFCDGITAHVLSKTGPGLISESARPTALTVAMDNYLSGTSSDYYIASRTAGANNLADWPATTKRFMIGDEWLLEPRYQADYIIHWVGIEYGPVTQGRMQEVWDGYSQYFKAMDAYGSGGYMILNGSMPVPVRIAYMASIFYPEIFGEDYGERMNQRFVDLFMDNLRASGYDASADGVFKITRDMVSP